MNQPSISQIEKDILQLPVDEQLRLISKLAQHISGNITKQHAMDEQLAAMASDEDIQKELKQIDEEFRVSESDGLENL